MVSAVMPLANYIAAATNAFSSDAGTKQLGRVAICVMGDKEYAVLGNSFSPRMLTQRSRNGLSEIPYPECGREEFIADSLRTGAFQLFCPGSREMQAELEANPALEVRYRGNNCVLYGMKSSNGTS